MTVAVDASTAPGPYAVMVTGSTGTLSPTCMQSINVIASGSPDFSLSASPSALTIIRGAFDLSTLSLTGLNGFSESVSLSTAVTNTLVGAPTASATPFSGGMSTYTVSIARSGQTGLFNVTAIGTTASGLSHATTITTKIVDFGMVCSTCVGIVAGDTAVDPAGTVDVSDFRLTSGSIFGFTGHVTFTCTVSPNIAGGPSCAPPFASKDYTVGSSFRGFAILTIPSTSAAGSYILTITGTYITSRGLVIHHDMVVITSSNKIQSCCLFDVQTYTITGSPSPLVIRHHGSTGSATSTITVAGQDGFSGLVNITATVPAVQGLTASLNTAQVNIPLNPDGSSGSGTATLTVNTDNHTPSGQYAVTITGQSLVVDAQGNNAVLTITGTVLVNVPSNKVQLNVVSFSPTVSVSAGGVQTWTYSVTNTLSTTQFVQVTVSGVSTSGTRPFQFVSAIVAVAAGGTATVTVTGTFGSMDQGLTFNFSQVMFFGSSATTLNQAFFTPAKNQFTVVA